MIFNYIFYQTDESFDYGDFPNSTCYQICDNGFNIDIDINDNINLSTFEGIGDFCNVEVKTFADLRKLIVDNFETIEDLEYLSKKQVQEEFEELLEFIKYNESRKVA